MTRHRHWRGRIALSRRLGGARPGRGQGRYNGTIVLKESFAPLWTISLVRGSGSILSKKAMESVGGKFTTELPAGSGPYVLKE